MDATLAAWGAINKGGWFKTGYLALVGQKKEMIICGGQNICPGEIEDLLVSHPKINQAVVVGISDPIMGEQVCACVTPGVGKEISFEGMPVEPCKELPSQGDSGFGF